MHEDNDLFRRLARLPVAVVSDVLAAMGLPDQVVAWPVRPLVACGAYAGPALCLAGREGADAPAPPGGSKPVYEMDRRVTPGCVAVIASGGHRRGAVIGGNVALAWKLAGCAGVVTDGGIRDLAEFEAFGLPVHATFATPMAVKGLWNFTTVDRPVSLPGQTGVAVLVHPGDAVHADADGVAIVPARHLVQAVHDAEIFEDMERKIQVDLRTRDDREAIYKRYDKIGHIKKVGA